jgi:hypothetical protein
VAEKIVAYYGAGVVDPSHVMKHEHEVMDAENEPSLVYRAYQMEKDFQAELHLSYEELKGQDAMPMGLDDLIMSMSNTHDTHVFLLQQRMGGKRGSVDHIARSNLLWQAVKDLGAKAIGKDQQDLALALESKDPRYLALLRGTPYEHDHAALVHAWGANRSRIPRRVREGIEQLWRESRRVVGEKAAFNSLEKSWMGHSSFAPMRHADDPDDLAELEQVWWLGNVPDPEAP